MQYQIHLETLSDFYEAIYAIPPRANRDRVTPRLITQQLLAALDNPQENIRSILITGSKGKGSSAIMLSSLLRGAGKTVGMFSSPHLFDFRERIVVDGEMIDQRSLLRLARQVFSAANNLAITHPDEFPRFFEVTTAIAYLYFIEKSVDYAVIETGIGALTDATNQDAHLLSVLTNIEAEHLDIFGDLSGVATEKSGVMRPNVPLILGDLPEAVDTIVIDKAAELAVPVTRFKSSYIRNNHGFYTVKVGEDVWIADSKLKAKNAWIALSAFAKLEADLTDEEKIDILSNTRLPAREEIVSKIPFVIIDGAHTAQSAQNLFNYVEKSVHSPVNKKVLMVSFSARKNIQPVIHAFRNADKIVITQATDSRSLSPKDIAEEIHQFDFLVNNPKIKLIENPLVALEKTLKKLEKDDVLVITGSVYLAGLLSQQFRL